MYDVCLCNTLLLYLFSGRTWAKCNIILINLLASKYSCLGQPVCYYCYLCEVHVA